MKRIGGGWLVFLAWLTLARADGAAASVWTNGVVASGHPLATRIGVEVLRAGGNAVDAAVAVGFALGVTEPYNSGLGGGCFLLIRRADGGFVAIDGREMAPAKATRDMYLRDGKGHTELSQQGALASGVPGALAAYAHAATNFGRLKLAQLIEPAARLAEQGFKVTPHLARRFAGELDLLKRFAGTREVVLGRHDAPPKAGETFRQPDLARSYRAIAAEGPGWFYRGPYARRLETWMAANGGILTAADLAGYQVRRRAPVRGTYRGHEIVSFPPPSSGGVHVVQILNLLEHFELAALKDQPVERLHLLGEAMKLAFADRAHWLGDPDFAKVPRGLTDKGYARELAGRIRRDGVLTVNAHGVPPGAETDFFERHTTHFNVADAAGNWVAVTATINTTFGSGVVIPGTGIFLNNEMDDFAIQPGVPNAFGLLGAEANTVAAGKRPLSSMSPTIVLRDGQPLLALGAAGGPTIITQTAQNIVGVVDLGLTLAEALAQPRVHHQWRPDALRVERKLPAGVREALAGKGHALFETGGIGVSQAVGRLPGNAGFTGAADPRAIGTADGW